MPRKTKAPTSARETSAVSKKAKEAKDPNGLRLDYLVWAWEFLRRNPEYKLLYALSTDELTGREKALDMLANDPITRALPIELFEVFYPECISGDTFGSWIDRAIADRQEFEFNEADIYDPRRYGLTTWIDPAIQSPDNIKYVFDFSLLELAEVWAINFKSEDQYKEFEQFGPSPRDFECELGLTATKPTHVAIRFDLRLPLDFQLAQAERQLKNAVEIYKENTHKNWHQIPDWEFRVNRQNTWGDMLKLLDLMPESSSNVDLFRRFTQEPDLVAYDKEAKALEVLLKKAKWLRDIGYRAILLKGIGKTPLSHWSMKKKAWRNWSPNRTPQP